MESMQFTIELDREEDGRWIADIPALNVLLYGDSKEDAVEKARSAALEIIQDRIRHGELPHEAANPVFAVAA
jgi:predicted RNase H-like HicB family nuclease